MKYTRSSQSSQKKTTVIVLCGGQSTEHEVSVHSAKSIIDALDKDKYDIIPVGITHEGKWLTGKTVEQCLIHGSAITTGEVEVTMLPDPNKKSLVAITKNNVQTDFNAKGDIVVFPVLHGVHGEDGTVQGFLELANFPYVGAGVLGSALGMDKVVQKEILKQQNIPVCAFDWFYSYQWNEGANEVLARLKRTFPNTIVFIKPANAGSSVGISKVNLSNEKETKDAIELALQFDRKIIVEEAQLNIMEIEVGVMGNDKPRASVCGQILPTHEFYDYDAKYNDDSTKLIIPAPIEPGISDAIRTYAVDTFKALECEGFARVDFFLDKKSGKILLNEINTIPGFTNVSMFPKLWEATGVGYTELVETLIQLARQRWEEKQKIVYSIAS